MISISDAVKKILKNSFFIEEALALKIVNFSSLARLLKPEIESIVLHKVDLNSIVMALRRYSSTIIKSDKKLIRWLQNCPDLLVRSNLVECTFQNSNTILACQKEFIANFENRQTVFFTITRGIFETTIIASQSVQKDLLNCFKNEKLIACYEHLSALSLQLTSGSVMVPGVYSFILKALFCQGINVMEVVSTLNELTLIIDENQVDRAFSTLKAIIRK